MNQNLFKKFSAAARELGHELRGVLADLPSEVAEPLGSRLAVSPHPTPLLVLTGYHSSGKSTLVEALTEGAFTVAIGSGVTTDQVTEYDWDGDVLLVDTPGVHAGRPEHDERAQQALQAADLVLFTVPVELFDNTLVAHLRDVLGRLGKARQTLIVITKIGTVPAPPPGVREDAIKQALGPFEEVPWVECDAQYYLEGLELADSEPAVSAEFAEASKLAEVTAAISNFARTQGDTGRLSQPFQLLLTVALEASASLTDDPNERAALTVLARQRSALSQKRVHLSTLLDARAAQFRTDAVRAASLLADDVERAEQGNGFDEAALEESLSRLNERLGTALTRLESAVKQVLEVQFDDLTSEVLEIEASPYGRLAVQLGSVDSATFRARHVAVEPGRSSSRTTPAWAGDLGNHLKHFKGFWGAGDGVKAAAGSNGHQIVLDVGHAFGKKFKPWEAVKVANNVGKVAKVGGVMVSVGLEAYSTFADERAAVKAERAQSERRRRVTQEVLAQADGIAGDALLAVNDNLSLVFGHEFERIHAMVAEIHQARSTRSALRDRLEKVQQQARTALRLLNNTTTAF